MTSRLSFVGNDGALYPLDGSDGIRIVDLADGLFTISTDLVVDQRVAGDGGTLVTSRHSPRRLTLSFQMSNTDSAVVMASWSALLAALVGGGSLEFDGNNGPRVLTQVVLESSTRDGWASGEDDVLTVSLLALDPWWYGPEVHLTGVFGAPTAWNAAIPWDSMLPWNGGASQIISGLGDFPTPADIVIDPGSGTAQVVAMSLNGVGGWETEPLGVPGARLTVSSIPGRRGPTAGSALHLDVQPIVVDWTLVTQASQVFDLPALAADLVFGITGAAGDEAWHVYFNPRFLTP